MKFNYQARTQEGELRTGAIEAATVDIAVSSLQRRGLVIVSLEPEREESVMASSMHFFERVKQKDIVVFSRQLATLFEAKVPVVESLKVIISEMDNPIMRREITSLLDDIQGGAAMSQAMARYPKVFSPFYVNMVRSGEESGNLDETFTYLANYLERSYELTTKARNALIYPAFVLIAFIGVIVLMMVFIIPKLTPILLEVGGELPIYTRLVIGASDFAQSFGVLILLIFALLGLFLWRYYHTAPGRLAVHRFQIAIPLVGTLYQKLFMARFADNLQTLLSGGIPVVRALEITAEVVGNELYRNIILNSIEAVKGGSSISAALADHPDIPPLMVQMIRIGEETGRLDSILLSLARFYQREVDNLVDNLVDLIEPILILVLGGGVGFLVAAILLPIYNITAQF
jgi:type II secretory pathway component PulF